MDCVFCEIIRTGVAEEFIDHEEYEGIWPVVSFVPLNPVVPGHRLFVPKHHFESSVIAMMSSSSAFILANEWAHNHNKQDCNIITSHGSLATQTIFHTHIHYVPRYENDGLLLPWTKLCRHGAGCKCGHNSIAGCDC